MSAAAAQPVEEIIVSAPRMTPVNLDRGVRVDRLDRDALDNLAPVRVDDALRVVPGASLFRRTGSLVANPTIQGVTLRGLGPNGAGRTLVRLDGVPINDPFGGWIYWSAIDEGALAGIDVKRAPGALEAGNQALTGVIDLTSAAPAPGHARLKLMGGSFDTLSAAGSATVGNDLNSLTADAQWLETDGYFLLPADARGPADEPSGGTAASGGLTARFVADQRTVLTLRGQVFEDQRRNGVVGARNRTTGEVVSIRLVRQPTDDSVGFELVGWARWHNLRQTFVAVFDDARSVTRTVLDQTSVPSRRIGTTGRLQLPLGPSDKLELGFDLRADQGRTNELFRNLGEGFTRSRVAGGDRLLLGGYADYVRDLTDSLSVNLLGRVDYWRLSDGVLEERDLADSALTRADDLSRRSDVLVNGRAAITWQPTQALLFRTSAYRNFRLPTLNEFFRPFRVGNDITEANAALQPERLTGVEAGVIYQPLSTVRVAVDVFSSWLKDGVGNVTLAQGPGFFPPTGFVPDGGSLRQRQNIDRIRATGVEAAFSLTLADGLTADLRSLWVDAEVTRFDAEPDLVGRRLAQSPRHSHSLALSGAGGAALGGRLGWTLVGRYIGNQFEDDLNTRRLGDAITLDASLTLPVSSTWEAFLRAENLFDATIIASRDSDGLITRGTPRAVWAGVRGRF